MRPELKIYLFFLTCILLVVLSDVITSENIFASSALTVDIMPSLVAIWWVSSSLSRRRDTIVVSVAMLLFNLIIMACHICRLFWKTDIVPDDYAMVVMMIFPVLIVGLQMYGMLFYIWDVKSMMKNVSVWTTVHFVVDVFYGTFIICGAVLVRLGLPVVGFLLLCGAIVSIVVREFRGSLFVLWRRQEKIIVEAMKISSIAASAGPQADEIYKEIYDRVVEFFEKKRPYLSNSLTINTVVKELYTNKVYISRAISRFTGRNFCQFVNFYRVMHSVTCFRKNPDLKIHELSEMCGFNSIVSYSMAFRLFMNETPSEWTRKERVKLKKPKKMSGK